MTTPAELKVLDVIRASLTAEFAGTFSPETVAACLSELMTVWSPPLAWIVSWWCSRSDSRASVCKRSHNWRESS